METLIVGLLLANLGVMVWIAVRVGDLFTYSRETYKGVTDVRRQVHPRIARASMQSGATTEEQSLRRLGRESASRRVVVGGDADSQLHRDLAVHVEQEDEDDRG